MDYNSILRANAPARTTDLDMLEHKIKIIIPNSLKELYLTSNGGNPEVYNIDVGDETYTISEFFPINNSSKLDNVSSITRHLLETIPLFPRNFIAFADDSSGDFFCVEGGQNDSSRVFFVCTEYYDEKDRLITPIAASLEDFASRLY